MQLNGLDHFQLVFQNFHVLTIDCEASLYFSTSRCRETTRCIVSLVVVDCQNRTPPLSFTP